MDEAVTGSVQILLQQYGLAGIVILSLAFVSWRFFKLYCTAQAQLNALHEKTTEEAKEDARANAAALERSTTAMNQLSELIRDRLRTVA